MNKYLVFRSDIYYPSEGLKDVESVHKTLKDAQNRKKEVKKDIEENGCYEIASIWNIKTLEEEE